MSSVLGYRSAARSRRRQTRRARPPPVLRGHPLRSGCPRRPRRAAGLVGRVAGRGPDRSGPGQLGQCPVRRMGPRARRVRNRQLGRERMVLPTTPRRWEGDHRPAPSAGPSRYRWWRPGRTISPPPRPSRRWSARPSPARGSGRPPGARSAAFPPSTSPRSDRIPIHTSYVVGAAWMDTKLLRATLYSGSQIPGGGPYLHSAPVSADGGRAHWSPPSMPASSWPRPTAATTPTAGPSFPCGPGPRPSWSTPTVRPPSDPGGPTWP